MKYIHIPTFIIFGVSIFCISTAHFELANAIQYCWTGTFVILILTYSLSMACMGKRIMLPKDKIMKTVCVLGIIEILYSIIQLFGFVPNNFHYAYFSGSLNNPAIFVLYPYCCILCSQNCWRRANDMESYGYGLWCVCHPFRLTDSYFGFYMRHSYYPEDGSKSIKKVHLRQTIQAHWDNVRNHRLNCLIRI